MIYPQIGSWYRRTDGRRFEVVAVDDEASTVEIQNFDGTIGELDIDIWHELQLESVVAPEDWTGAVDVDQDAVADFTDTAGHDWMDPMRFIDGLE